MYETTDFRKGLKIEYDNKAFEIVEFQHVNPGKGSAFVRTRIKNLETGKVIDVTFKAGVDKVGVPDLASRQMQYLYNDGTNYHFMDTNTYDQVSLTNEDVGDAQYYLIENSQARVTYYRGKPVSIDLDNFVELTVKETQPNIRGDTSSGGGKPATMETGLTINVPFHINAGDVLKIDTRTNRYVEKVK
ncbi:MAG: elongation factor P [Deltaproteobacteria bacterium]|nr:elongation factor P [Deltaproteobacteria bacterium]